jgi:hypothetical protein
MVKLYLVRPSCPMFVEKNLTNQNRDTWNKSPEERLFLQRLDSCLITYATLSYFSKYLDQHNIIVSVPCHAGSPKRV